MYVYNYNDLQPLTFDLDIISQVCCFIVSVLTGQLGIQGVRSVWIV